MTIQLELWETPVPERAPEPVGPFICPWCGREEGSHFSLINNHWHTSYRSIADRECISMNLTRNHVRSYARTVATDGDFIGCCYKHRKFDAERGMDELRARLRSVREVWPTDRLTWVRTVLVSEHLPTDLIDELIWEAA